MCQLPPDFPGIEAMGHREPTWALVMDYVQVCTRARVCLCVCVKEHKGNIAQRQLCVCVCVCVKTETKARPKPVCVYGMGGVTGSSSW